MTPEASKLLRPLPEDRAAEDELEEREDGERNSKRVPQPTVGNCLCRNPDQDANSGEPQQDPREKPCLRRNAPHAAVISLARASVLSPDGRYDWPESRK